jgi:hypothetical protein
LRCHIYCSALVSAALALFCAAIFGAGTSVAQSRDERDINADLARERRAAQPAQASAGDFTIALSAPLLHTSNAVLDNSGASPVRRGDWHYNPDVVLRWSHQFDAVRLAISADANSDRYFRETSADLDAVYGVVKLSLTDGTSDAFVPFAVYRATAEFLPTFGDRLDLLNDFALGFSSGFGIAREGGVVAMRAASHPGDVALSLDLRAGRRLADPKDFQNSFAVLSVEATYVYDETIALIVAPRFRVRWYDAFFGTFRRDYRPSLVVRATWKPQWLTQRLPGAEFSASVTALRNFSNLPDERFSEWEVGPAVGLSWKF